MRNVEDKMQNAKLWKAVERWVKCIMRKFAVCQICRMSKARHKTLI